MKVRHLCVLVLLVACDGGGECMTEAECCMEDPTRPECAPTCEEDPTQPVCEVDCSATPTDPSCLPSCEVDPAQLRCRASCEDDPEGPSCVPASRRPSASVTVLRDSLGIPHAFASTDADAMWASGYLQATDRLWQMDMARRLALGRQAEVLGADAVGADTVARLTDLEGWAYRGLLALRESRPDLYALHEAWTAGVNARIDEVLSGDAPMPLGFEELGYAPEPWQRVDGAAALRAIFFLSGSQLDTDLAGEVLREFVPDLWGLPFLMPLEDAFVVPEEERPARMSGTAPPVRSRPAAPRRALPPNLLDALRRIRLTERNTGSNNWAVAGRHTENGRPLIATDPHQRITSPATLWAHHMHSDEGLDVAGFAFVGSPGVHLGHNANVVFTATINYPDMMDLWEVQVVDGQVLIGEDVVPIARRVETIEVAGAEAIELTVERAPGHGVLLPEDYSPLPLTRRGRRMLFGWTGLEVTHELDAVDALDRAGNVDDIETAADTFELGPFHFIAADASDIAYVSSCRLPTRNVSSEQPPWALLDGDDATLSWTGDDLPRVMLPRSRGGARGWLASANNDPLGFTADGDPLNDAFYYGNVFDPGTRAARIHDELERLTAAGGVTVADMETLQTDRHSVFADHLVPLIEQAWAQVDANDALAAYRGRADLDALVTLLSSWDRQMDRDDPAPVVFSATLFLFTQLAIQDEAGAAFELLMTQGPNSLIKLPLLAAEGAWPGSETIFQEGLETALLGALDQAAAWLVDRFSTSDPSAYTWADAHCTRVDPSGPVEALGLGCVPTDGGNGTINIADAAFLVGGELAERHEATNGAVFRMVSTFGDDGVPEAMLMFAPGNVEDPTSAWFDNNLGDWTAGRYRPLPFRRAEVEADAQEMFTIEP